VTAQIEQQVLELRQRLNNGVRRLQNELVREYGVHLGLETIHKILRKHQVAPLRQSQRSRTVKRYQKAIPGERVQMDTCKVRPGVYLYTAIDDCSRYLVVGVYGRRSAKNTLHFITERVLEEMHFPIQRFQTDNGTEFTAYPVQDLLAAYSIRFRPIRPRTPHLNGKVERAQQTVLTEFFATLDGAVQALTEIDEALAVWQHDTTGFVFTVRSAVRPKTNSTNYRLRHPSGMR
jgi:transposase InsO family protein